MNRNREGGRSILRFIFWLLGLSLIAAMAYAGWFFWLISNAGH